MSYGKYYCSLCGYSSSPCMHAITDTNEVMRLHVELAIVREQAEKARTENEKHLDSIKSARGYIDHIESQCDALRAELVAERCKLGEWERAVDTFMVVNWIGVYDAERSISDTFKLCIEKALDAERDALRAENERLRASMKAVLHQLEYGEASEGDTSEIKWCACELRATLKEE